MTDDEIKMNPWVPMSDPCDLKHIGKLIEELGEAISAAARCQIQGIDEREPVTGKLNKEWLEDELADVMAGIALARDRFGLDMVRMEQRTLKKMRQLQTWHMMLVNDHG